MTDALSREKLMKRCLSHMAGGVIKQNYSVLLVQVRHKICSLTCYTSNDRIHTQGKTPDSCYSPFAIWENVAILGAKMWGERKEEKKREDYLVLLRDSSSFWRDNSNWNSFSVDTSVVIHKYIKLWVDHQDELENGSAVKCPLYREKRALISLILIEFRN